MNELELEECGEFLLEDCGTVLLEGFDPSNGTFTLSQGMAWVPNNNVNDKTIVETTCVEPSGVQDWLRITLSLVSGSVGFNVFGSALDNSTYNYRISDRDTFC